MTNPKKTVIPNKVTHWIQHGEIGHPHETAEDVAHNSCRSQTIANYRELEGEVRKVLDNWLKKNISANPNEWQLNSDNALSSLRKVWGVE